MNTTYLLYLGILTLVNTSARQDPSPAQLASKETTEAAVLLPANPLVAAFYEPDKMLRQSVETIYNSMSPEQRAAQMIMVATTSSRSDYKKARELVADEIAGSVLLLKGSKQDFKAQVAVFDELVGENGMQLLYACDCEPSLLQRKWSDASPVVPASLQATDSIVRKETNKIAYQMHEVGAGLNFAPVVDIAANKSIISNRSFGNEAAEAIRKSAVFINTSQQAGIAATVKHFPGHGAVKGDSHKSAVYIDGALTELETFKQTIALSRPLVVMVGHINIRNNSRYGTKGLPSSISRTIMTDLLRTEMGFEGIITTDAMNMKAVSRFNNADWLAAAAGADLIVMPANPRKLHSQITAALQRGDSLSLQLEQSIMRVIRMKLATDGYGLPVVAGKNLNR